MFVFRTALIQKISIEELITSDSYQLVETKTFGTLLLYLPIRQF